MATIPEQLQSEQRQKPTPATPPPQPSSHPEVPSKEPKEGKGIAEGAKGSVPPATRGDSKKTLQLVPPPLSNVPLNKFIYALLLTIALLGAYYSYRLVQYKTQLGGWWNLALGRPVSSSSTLHTGDNVEHKLDQLAHVLGVPAEELARGVAGVVREHVPPASLSSIAAKETGRAVKVLLEYAAHGGHGKGGSHGKASDAATAVSEGAANIVNGAVNGVKMFVGTDDEP